MCEHTCQSPHFAVCRCGSRVEAGSSVLIAAGCQRRCWRTSQPHQDHAAPCCGITFYAVEHCAMLCYAAPRCALLDCYAPRCAMLCHPCPPSHLASKLADQVDTILVLKGSPLHSKEHGRKGVRGRARCLRVEGMRGKAQGWNGEGWLQNGVAAPAEALALLERKPNRESDRENTPCAQGTTHAPA